MSKFKDALDAIKADQENAIPIPKDFPPNIYSQPKDTGKKGLFTKMMGMDMSAIQDPMRYGFRILVDSRDQQWMRYLKEKGLLGKLNE